MTKIAFECVLFVVIILQIIYLGQKLNGVNESAAASRAQPHATMIAGTPIAPLKAHEVINDGYVPMKPLPSTNATAGSPLLSPAQIGSAIAQQATNAINPGALQKQAEIEAQRIMQSGDMTGFVKKLEHSGLIAPSSSGN